MAAAPPRYLHAFRKAEVLRILTDDRRLVAASVQSGASLSKGLPDNRCSNTLFQQMTETEQQAVPHGFTQITKGRIRTTDIICGGSGGWAVPHVFLVGGDIADDGRSIARPHVKKPGGRS